MSDLTDSRIWIKLIVSSVLTIFCGCTALFVSDLVGFPAKANFFQPLSVNGVSDRQADIEMSAEQELRHLQSQGPKDQPRSTTQQLEPRSMPPHLANTLEHIVGQLDILTQVCEYVSLYYIQ